MGVTGIQPKNVDGYAVARYCQKPLVGAKIHRLNGARRGATAELAQKLARRERIHAHYRALQPVAA
jgi:hypothetical protein